MKIISINLISKNFDSIKISRSYAEMLYNEVTQI